VPHRAETRSAGRHRLTARSRTRTRTVLLTATLGTALAIGVAGGTAAAAAHRPAPAANTDSSRPTLIALQPAEPLQQPDQPAAPMPADAAVAARVAINLAADPARKKSRFAARTAQTAARKTRPAAWVNPNPAAIVTSCFGQRWGRLHAGVDMAGPNGAPIVAAGAGVVTAAGAASGYGNAVLIDHGNGYLTHYGHMSVITVQVGQRVTAGQQIGDEGSTGHSTGPHLHFEVHQGYYQNPIEPTAWMHAHGVDIGGCQTF
jgi:murein DD-endopeptidase MepM/ murein hydrolase activator NlpD